MANRSWPGFGRLGTSPGWEVPVAGRDAAMGGAARERRAPGTPLLPSAAARAAVWRLALCGLFTVSALPGVAGLAHADALVSNLGQTTSSAVHVADGDARAQRFRTGSNAAGYDLTSVEVDVASIPDTPASVTASIYSLVLGTRPDRKLIDLANPATFSVGANVFTAPSGATLSANTGYFVVVAYGATSTEFTLNATDSEDEDSEGATGWTIHDSGCEEGTSFGTFISWLCSSAALKTRINGSATTADTTAPMLMSATTTALEVGLFYDENLDGGSEPAPSAFTVTVDGASRTVTGVSADGTKVRLTLASAVRAGDTVTVSYTVPMTGRLQDEASNPAAGFTDHPVTNEVPATVPDAPSGLTATPGDGSVTLRWTASAHDGGSAITGHQYRQKTTGGFGSWQDIELSAPGEANATSFLVTSLMNGTSYTFEVQARNAEGESGPSNQASATPGAGDITAPMLVSATTTALELALTYDENLDAGSEPAPAAFTVTVNGASRGVTGVSADGTKVRLTLASAVRAGDTVTVSYTVPMTNLLRDEANNPAAPFADHPVTNEVPATVPGAPTNLVVGLLKEGVGGPTLVALVWMRPVSDGGSEITYQYRWKTTGAFGDWQNSEAAPVRGNFIGWVIDLPINARYTVEVRARNVAGYSGPSNQSSVTVVDSRLVTPRSLLVEGDRLEATYSEALDAGFEPGPSAFTVTVNGASWAVTGVSLDGAKLILTLASPVQPDDVVRFAYAIPDTNALRGESGNFIAGFGLDDLTVRHPYTRPAYGQVVQSDRLEVTFYKALDAGFEPAPSAFTVTVDRVSRAVTGVSLDGANVILTLASPVQPDDFVLLAYTVPDANALRGESGSFIAGFEDFWVENPLSYGPEDRSRVVQGDRLEVTFIEALDADFEPAPSAFEVTFNNIPQEVTGVSLDGAKVILTLGSPVRPGDVVRVSYTVPDTNALRDESGSAVAGFDKRPVTNLDTASTGIALTLAPTSVHEDGGATEVTVTASLDAGARTEATEVTVSVAGNTAIAGTDFTAVEPFTVTIPAMQTSTTTVFTFIPIQDETAEGAETVTVSGTSTSGLPVTSAVLTLTDDDTASTAIALALDPGSVAEGDDDTEVTVTALLNDGARTAATEVTVSVAGNTATADADFTAVDGFTVTIPAMETSATSTFTFIPIQDDTAEADETLTVSGSATGLTVDTATLTLIDDDARGVSVHPTSVTVTKGDANAGYAVKLATKPTSDVTVMVHGANADVSVSPRSLTFTSLNWDRPQTVTVEAVNDSVAEREERVTLTHTVSGGDYDGVAAAPVSVQVVNNDVGVVAEWLVRAGRTVAGQAVDVLTARLDGGGESYLALGEHRLVGSSGAALERDAGDGRMRSVGREQPLTERELLLGSAFHLRSGAGEPGSAAFATWGRIASDRFAGKADGLALDGEIRTSFVGADLSAGRWLAGAALAFSKGEGGYGLAGEGGDRAVASRLTSLFPYAQVRLSERISAWTLVGRGTGKLTLIERGGTGADRYDTDIEMHMGAAGVGGALATAPAGIELGLRSDVFWMRTSSDPIEEMGVASSELEANRLRLVLDASRPFTVGDGTTLTPSLEVGVRQDGGDAETGRGVEVGAGLRYAGTGFRIEGTVRGLALHDESAYEEWGASGSVHIEPGGAGRGLSFTLAPAWGNPSSAGRRLWSARDAVDLAPTRDIEAGRRLDAEVGYGLRSPSGPGVVTPYAAISVGEGAGRTLRTGTRWRLAPAATLGLEASRAGSPGGDEGPVNALTLRASVRW